MKTTIQNDRGRPTIGAIPGNLDKMAKRRTNPTALKDIWGRAYDPHSVLKGLKREFGFPPFTVWNARDGLWQARKRLWLKLGIESELGRNFACKADQTFRIAPGGTKEENWPIDDTTTQGVSVFDPVVCELAYRWFCPPGGMVLDPFAGGSVRGIVAACMGRRYFGVDLSAAQIAANKTQGAKLLSAGMETPTWVCGDSKHIRTMVPAGYAADILFSCPPYGNLEVYSNDERDISNMLYEDFLICYKRIVRRSASLLKPNRFAVWVVGEIRGSVATGCPSGHYRGLVPDTIAAFREAGLEYYNEAVLVTAVGSLPLRTRRQFHASRKMGKSHQNVLVFVKGDPKLAAAANPLGDGLGE